MMTREDCARLDAQDDLAELREKFRLPEGVIYLDGNSLGALPEGAVNTLSKTVEQEWGEGLIRSWGEADWFTLRAARRPAGSADWCSTVKSWSARHRSISTRR